MRQNERFVKCILGEPIDRIPFFPIWGPWEETARLWKKQGMKNETDWYDLFRFDNVWKFMPVDFGVYPRFSEEIIADEGETIVKRDWRGFVKRSRKDEASMPQFLEYPVKDRESWEKFKKERLNPDTPGRFPEDWAKQVKEMKERNYPLVLGNYPWGFFGTPRDFFGVEEFLVKCALEPELIDEVNRHLCRLWLTLWNRVLDDVDVDVCWLWEDMAGRQGSLISPEMFRRFMTPYYRRLFSAMRKRGIRIFMVDCDGYIEDLIPLFREAGVNLLWPFEVQAGNDIMRVRTRYPELGIMAGIDKRILAHGKAEIDREIARVREVAKLGRYIPSSDHLLPPDATWENYKYFVKKWKEMVEKLAAE